MIGQNFNKGTYRKSRKVQRGAINRRHLAQFLCNFYNFKLRMPSDASKARVWRRHVFAQSERARVDEKMIIMRINAHNSCKHSGGNVFCTASSAIHLLPIVKDIISRVNIPAIRDTLYFNRSRGSWSLTQECQESAVTSETQTKLGQFGYFGLRI
jgi:hypothetical protein